jgi:hypothetical protein
VLSIPVYPELAPDERERVAEAVEGFYAVETGAADAGRAGYGHG